MQQTPTSHPGPNQDILLSMGDYYRSDTPLAPLAWVGQFNVTF